MTRSPMTGTERLALEIASFIRRIGDVDIFEIGESFGPCGRVGAPRGRHGVCRLRGPWYQALRNEGTPLRQDQSLDTLMGRLSLLLSDHVRQAPVGESARRFLTNHLNPEDIAQQTEAFFHDMLGWNDERSPIAAER
ncbi:MAG: hypothetical protein AAF608_09790 [Pseudomonadota bacterium]